MVCGCACVVADTGGLREIVPGDGSVGLRFTAGNSGSLQRELERVLFDDALRVQITAAARVHVRRFDWTSIARDTRLVYGALVQDEHGMLTPK
jgi:glycosyltransferase involved in cell wall biosynthesis